MQRRLAGPGERVSETFTKGFKYRTCRPNEWMIKIGLGITDEVISQKCFQWPFQRVTLLNMSPRNFSFTLHCISQDMVPFDLPVVFTCGPHDPSVDESSFKKYASKMASMDEGQFESAVLGVIHGQTRLYAAGLTVLQMFSDRDAFKGHIQDRIEKELANFGLKVFNGNVAEMRDREGSKYFESLKQKAISTAVNNARVATAEAEKTGDIGETEKQAETTVRKAEVQASVQAASNTRQQQIERSRLELNLVNIECDKKLKLEEVEANLAPQRKQLQYQTELNQLEGQQKEAFLRATDLAKTNIQAEQQLKQAEAAAMAKRKSADAELYVEQKKAEAQLYKEQQKAAGILAVAEAQAKGLERLAGVADKELVKFYLGVETGYFEKMAQNAAKTVQGMQPKVNVWNTGASGEAGSDSFAPLRNILASIPPMADAIESQTGLQMPNWMPNNQNQIKDARSLMENGTHHPASHT